MPFGIPSFAKNLPPRHRFWAWVYNRTAFGYDFGVRWGWRLALGGAAIQRESYLAKINIAPGQLVLETAVGTGANLALLPANARYVGVDLSLNMLRRCRQNLAHTNRPAALIHADMLALPFLDHSFDVVFHMGGLQFVNDPARAIAEVTRVAKPGSRITLVDETDSIPKILSRSRKEGHAPFTGVADLLGIMPPAGVDPLPELISEGELYCLSFTKHA